MKKVTPSEYPLEHDRLNHFSSLSESLSFAKQTSMIYRTAINDNDHYASSRAFKQSFENSIVELDKFIKEHE